MAVVMATVALALVAVPAGAWAGQWVQVSCVNPDGSSASSQGWVGSVSGPVAPVDTYDTACGPGTPMTALFPASTPGPIGASVFLTYSPPAGSTLAGGTVSLQLSAEGFANAGTDYTSSGFTSVGSASDQLETCAAFSGGCWVGPSASAAAQPSGFTGTLTLPTNQGGGVSLDAACIGESNSTDCADGASDGVWAGIWVSSADLLLTNNASPGGSDFGGTLLDPNASGTAALNFTASESNGPGVYTATVDMDGSSVYSGTPDTNSGACVSHGSFPGTSALEFDSAQPCSTSEGVSIPINTTVVSNGSHELTVTLTDAAGNTATVLDQGITIDNRTARPTSPTETTTRPKAKRGVKALGIKFVISDSYVGAHTRLKRLTTLKALPANATLSVSDSGPKHPRISPSRATAKRAKALLVRLTKLTFTAGDTLTITVTAPGHTREVVRLSFRSGKPFTYRHL